MKIELPIVDRAQQFKAKYKTKLTALSKDKQLDMKVQETHQAVFAKINCLDCANCCKTTGPLFIQSDIERIARHLKIKPGQFIQTYLQMDEDGDFVLQSLPCPFLKKDNYCSIYEVRPKACQQYPHTHQKNQQRIFEITLKNMEICPGVLEIFRRMTLVNTV